MIAYVLIIQHSINLNEMKKDHLHKWNLTNIQHDKLKLSIYRIK